MSGVDAAQPEWDHRCLVVVHGIGEELRASTLVDVGEPLAAFLDRHLGPVAVERADVAPTGGNGAESALRFGEEALIVREAWWAARFLAPPFTPVLIWTTRIWWAQVRSLAWGLLYSTGLIERSEPIARRVGAPVKPPREETVYRSPARTWQARLYDLVMGLGLFAFFTLGVLLVFVLIVVAWTLQGLGNLLNLPGPIRTATELLEHVYVRYIGDVYVYFNSYQIRAAVRGAVMEAIEPSLASHHAATCRGLTIVAHSWGTVVALDALLQLSRAEVAHPPLTLMTVGAALNRVWWMRSRDPLRLDRGAVATFWQDLVECAPMAEWLGRIRWVNLWSRYDPVPAGPLEPGLREHLGSIGVEVLERRVVNLDDPLGDHTSYWENAPEVQSRIAYEVIGHPDPAPRAILDAVDGAAARRRAVGLLAFVRLAAVAVGTAIGLALFAELAPFALPWRGSGMLETWAAPLVLLYAWVLLTVLPLWRPGRPSSIAVSLLVGMLLGVAVTLLVAPTAWYVAVLAWLRRLPALLRGAIDLALLVGAYKIVRSFWFDPLLADRSSVAGAAAATQAGPSSGVGAVA